MRMNSALIVVRVRGEGSRGWSAGGGGCPEGEGCHGGAQIPPPVGSRPLGYRRVASRSILVRCSGLGRVDPPPLTQHNLLEKCSVVRNCVVITFVKFPKENPIPRPGDSKNVGVSAFSSHRHRIESTFADFRKFRPS